MGFRGSVARVESICENRTCNLWRLKTWRQQNLRDHEPVNHYVTPIRKPVVSSTVHTDS